MKGTTAAQVANLKRAEGQNVRRAFTLPELKKIISVANDEWRGMIALGVYTGQRLSDLALLCWHSIDAERKEIRLIWTAKAKDILAKVAGARKKLDRRLRNTN